MDDASGYPYDLGNPHMTIWGLIGGRFACWGATTMELWFRQTSTMVRRGTRGISPKIGSCDVGITWNYSNLPRLGRWRPDWVVEELNPQPLRHTAYLYQAMNLVQGSKMSQFSWVEESTHDLTCYPVGCFLITSMWRVTHGFSYRKLWSTYGVFFTDTCYTPVN